MPKLEQLDEPTGLQALKDEVVRRWGVLDLLDVLKNADFLTGFTDEFSSVAAYERIDRDALQRRLLLALFALGTNMGIRAIVATGEHGETEAALRHVRRHFITVDNLRAAVTKLVNATFASRDTAWWGQGHRMREGLEEVRLLVLELHDRVPRTLRRQRRDDLLARRAQKRLHLLPTQILFILRGRGDDRGSAAALHRRRDRVQLRRHPRRLGGRIRLHRAPQLPPASRLKNIGSIRLYRPDTMRRLGADLCGRSRSAMDTFAQYQHLIEPAGISRIADITGLDVVGVPVALGVRPLARSLVIAVGKGLDLWAARTGALMESLECWYAETAAPDVLGLNATALGAAPELSCADVVDLSTLPTALDAPVGRQLDDQLGDWICGRRLRSRVPVWVPFEAVSLDYRSTSLGRPRIARNSNGLASGNLFVEAVVHGLCEVIERDAEWRWRASSESRRVRMDTVEDPRCRQLLKAIDRAGLRGCWVAGWLRGVVV